jgi:type I restriction-modification system DNA methylase subunit
MPANTTDLEKRLWGAADEFRANSKLKSSEYSVPVLGPIFLRYADHKFTQAKAKFTSQGSGRRTIGKANYSGPWSALPARIRPHLDVAEPAGRSTSEFEPEAK